MLSRTRTRAATTCVALLLPACGGSAAGGILRAAPPPLPTPGRAVAAGADSITVLPSGEATAAELLRLLRGARDRVEVEMYELGRSDLVAALESDRARGVDVRVIADPSVDVTSVSAERLRAAGVDVVDYPLRPMMIDHVKLLIVDSDVAVAGGINWGAGSFENRDFDVEVSGPVVANLERVYARDLVTAGRPLTVPDAVPDPAIVVATTLPGTEIRPLALALIDGARDRLDLALYVLTDTAIVSALERAHARGVRITLVLDPSERPSDASVEALRRDGIPVHLYAGGGELLHAKALVADGESVLFGSANWSGGGFRRNHELDLEIPHAPGVAATFVAAIDADYEAGA